MGQKIDPYVEEILASYYENNAKKLHNVVNLIFYRKYGGISGRDMDEFYSVANDVCADIIKRYDESKGDFDGLLYGALNLAIVDELKRQNRDKRTCKIDLVDEKGCQVMDKDGKPKRIPIPDVYMDAPIGEDGTLTIEDTIQSDFDIDTALSGEFGYYCDESITEYLDSLPEMPKKIAKLIMEGYEACDIKGILNITDRQYRDCWNVLSSYDKKRILYKSDKAEEETMSIVKVESVTEKYKNTSYSIESISRQLKKKRIRDDHILQRHSGQWKGFAKSELISDILRGKSLTQIIISEEIRNDIKMQWLIDGKQRCTTLDDYLHDGFAISKNVKNYNIKYQAPKVDCDGNEVLNEEGFTDMEWKTFDIRGKKFSQLPEELQDIFKDRQIPVLYNMDCTKQDIADDIARFNRSRPMNASQNGWLGLDESFAELVGNIAKMPFFQPGFIGSTYTSNNETSGAIRRIIVESIMVSDFIDEFSAFDKMCEFLSEEAGDSNFTEFYALVERLTVICNTKEIASLFDAKDSFLWFGLFSRFVKLGLEDKRFADFMNEFESLRKMKINGRSFDNILGETKATKDKSIVIKKLTHLEELMKTYLNVEDMQENMASGDYAVAGNESFIAKMLGMDLGKVADEMEIYDDTLRDLADRTIKDGSKLLDEANRQSLLAMVAYSYQKDKDLDTWMEKFAEDNDTYLIDPEKNFLHMRDDFEKFCHGNEKMSA